VLSFATKHLVFRNSFVVAGTWFPIRFSAMDVCSGSIIPAFSGYATVIYVNIKVRFLLGLRFSRRWWMRCLLGCGAVFTYGRLRDYKAFHPRRLSSSRGALVLLRREKQLILLNHCSNCIILLHRVMTLVTVKTSIVTIVNCNIIMKHNFCCCQ
jgi:hypothetical protein